MKRLIAIAGIVAIGALGMGCHHMHGFHGGGLYVPVAPVAVAATNLAVTAAIVGTAIALSTAHDAHLHWDQCGCQRQWHEGRWVYWYGGWWEFHDPNSGSWYHY